jgi:uncharacterized membrane protein YecN with MAPEG domain
LDVLVPHNVLLYAALLALLFVALSMRALRLSSRLCIAIGDAGNESMLRAMRVHKTTLSASRAWR